MRSCALGSRWKMYLAFVLVRNPAFILALKLLQSYSELSSCWNCRQIVDCQLSIDSIFENLSAHRLVAFSELIARFSLAWVFKETLFMYKHCLHAYKGFDVLYRLLKRLWFMHAIKTRNISVEKHAERRDVVNMRFAHTQICAFAVIRFN